ncbi:putative acyl-CoA dehydrogenase AidB-like protein, partial [Dinothrombium tinctorium]
MSNLFSKFKVCLQLNQKRLKTSGLQKPSWIPFSKAKFGEFIQQKPSLNNAFTDDGFVQRLIRHYLPKNVLTEVTPDLTRFGERIVSEIEDIGRQCELQQPKLYFDDGWGKVETRLWTSSAWKKQKEISAEEGLVAIAYERNFREFSRIYQLMKLYLYIPSSGLYSCPLAMTDGAAKTIEDLQLNESFYKNAYTRLTSRDPNLFWTSGQWMTEKGGGSDVARGTETLAIPEGDKTFRLYGYKWFSSATDSDVTLTLARISDLEGNVLSGTRGLTLFFLKTRENDKLNNIQIVKLKDKLGTRQLPTAELLLDGTLAYK